MDIDTSPNEQWLNGKKGEGVSIITAVKNRNDNLVKTLPSWLKVKNVDEIIVIDWNSDTEVYPLFGDIVDERVKIIRVENNKTWRTCRAFNLAVRAASYNKIMRLDSDYLVEPGIVDAHELKPKTFITGYWGNARNLNEIYTNGFVYFFKEDFISVNGYNESFQMYGYDDDDFYNRMEALPLKKLTVNNNFVYHIPHNVSLRSNEFDLVNKSEIVSKAAHTDLTIRTNDYLSKNIVIWGPNHSIPQYDFKQISTNQYSAIISDYKDDYFTDQQIKIAQDSGKAILMSRDTEIKTESFQKSLNEEEIHELFLLWNRSYELVKEKSNGFHLLISLYNEKDVARCYELLKCLSSNLLNPNIKEVTVFYDSSKNYQAPLFVHSFIFKHKIKHHFIGGKPKFSDLFKYAEENELGKCIIANSDILYDDTLKLIADQDLTNKLLTLSRKNLNKETNKFELITWENGTPQYFSADSWIFETSFPFSIREDVKLGTMHSEPFLANHLFRQKSLSIYNPCLDVNSFHLQRGESEMERMNTVGVKERDELYKKEFNNIGGADPISGVIWCHSKDLESTKHSQYRASKNYIYIQIDDNFSRHQLNTVLKFAESIDRNIWVYKATDNSKLKKVVATFNNNINVTENDLFKSFSKQMEVVDNFASLVKKQEKDIWLKLADILQNINEDEFTYLKLPEVKQPKISIITPAYNAAEYIEEAILSVLNQDYKNFEHIIMDAGSKDGTVEILKKYDHLIWVSEKDKGQSDAMNKGFQKATGSIIGYLNADDYYLPDAFSKIVPYFENGAHFLTGKIEMAESDGTSWINNPSNSHARWLVHWAQQAFPYNPVGYFYRKEVQAHVGGYVDDNHYSMDFEFLLEVASAFSIHRVQEALGVFRFVKGNKSSFIMEKEDFWSDNKFGYVKNYLSNFTQKHQKSYLSARKFYYKLNQDQVDKLQELNTPEAVNAAPAHLKTMRIQRNVVLEFDSIKLSDKEIKTVAFCILNRFDECYLESYYNYYTKLGVDCFYILGDFDQTEKILPIVSKFKSVKYFSLDLDIKLFKKDIINHVLTKFLKHKWIINTSVSEYIKLPFANYVEDISTLVEILEHYKFTGIVSNNVEMIPPGDYVPALEKTGDFINDFTNTTLDFTDKNNHALNDFKGNTLSDYKIQRHLNDTISGIINHNRDITNIPIFFNDYNPFVNEKIPSNLILADFNLYTKKYTLVKHFYLDLITDDLKYYKVFDLNYDLEQKLGEVFTIMKTFNVIDESKIEKALIDKTLLVFSPRLLEYVISVLYQRKIATSDNASNDNILLLKDLMTNLIAVNNVRFNWVSSELTKGPVSSPPTVVTNYIEKTTPQDTQHLEKVYNSYSWKIGNGIIKKVEKYFSWIPAVKKAKENA